MSQAEDAQSPGATPGSSMDEKKARADRGDDNTGSSHAIITNKTAREEEKNPDPASPPLRDFSPGATTTTTRTDEDLTTKIFQFFSTATPGTLGAVALALAAVTYFIIGQIGLLLIGAFGGIVLFIQWEQRNAGVARAVRGERGYDVLARLVLPLSEANKALREEGLLNGTGDAAAADDEEAQVRIQQQERTIARSFDEFPPETRDALNELVDAVIRDYVKWWYAPIVPSDKFFPLACRKVFTSFLASISSHLYRKRPADAFLDFVTNTSSIVIVFFSELSNAFAELPSDSKMSAADAIYSYLATNPDSSLSNLLSQRQQAGKFRMVSEDLLNFLERSTYECDPARVFLREILADVVLEMTLQTCSKADWINSWIVYLLEAGEPDISQAIDVGMQTGPSTDPTFADIDGNLGNIGLARGNRNSFEMEKSRRKESITHKKQLSKADEEMEVAMEEMKRMNQMIAAADAQRSKKPDGQPQANGQAAMPRDRGTSASANEASERLVDAIKRNADELVIRSDTVETHITAGNEPQSPAPVANSMPRTSIGDGLSSNDISPMDSASQPSSPNAESTQRFTSFDQIVPATALAEEETESGFDARRKPPPLTLHHATITVLDEPGDKGRMRTKPTWDYLIQIEPATTAYPGWMIVRRYSDFERLHEILRRIATISGAKAFNEQHDDLPSWKVHTRTSLRGELERYMRDACWYQSLAESAGLKKFLEKDTAVPGHAHNGSKSGFQAFERLGKNMFDVLTNVPLEGSKAVVGGVTGVLGNIGLGQRKSTMSSLPGSSLPGPSLPGSSSLQDVTAASRLSMSTPPPPRMESIANSTRKPRDSLDSQRSSVVSLQPGKAAPMERQPSYNSLGEIETDAKRLSRSDMWDRPTPSSRNSREHSRVHSRASSLAAMRSPSSLSFDGLKLPPPPDAMPDEYEFSAQGQQQQQQQQQPHENGHDLSRSMSPRSMTMPNLGEGSQKPNGTQQQQPPPKATTPVVTSGTKQKFARISEPETRVAVELLFAVINELYTLSSAWNIRRTLLAAAKSFLLRPGNPSLASIQSLIQTEVLDTNTSDAGVAAHLRKLRENTMPTEAERATWPVGEEGPAADEKRERQRQRARKLLIESGVPTALMGVMGQTATSDALGRIFDCLQIEEVARGLMFGILLQAVRVITH